MKYSEYHHERVSVDDGKKSRRTVETFQLAEFVEDQIVVIKEMDESSRNTLPCLHRQLEFQSDACDEEAKAEKEYYDSIGPNMAEINNRWAKAVDASRFKSNLEVISQTYLAQSK